MCPRQVRAGSVKYASEHINFALPANEDVGDGQEGRNILCADFKGIYPACGCILVGAPDQVCKKPGCILVPLLRSFFDKFHDDVRQHRGNASVDL